MAKLNLFAYNEKAKVRRPGVKAKKPLSEKQLLHLQNMRDKAKDTRERNKT